MSLFCFNNYLTTDFGYLPVTAIIKNPSPARTENKINGGGTSSMPADPIILRYQATEKQHPASILLMILKNTGTRFNFI